MKKTMKSHRHETWKIKALLISLALFATAPGVLTAAPIGTAFTYQGNLSDGGSPATGYYDLRFTLHGAANGGGSLANPIALDQVGVTNGFVTVQLDFGGDIFSEGACWLEMAVRTSNSTNAFTILSPRQLITAAPLANYASSAVPRTVRSRRRRRRAPTPPSRPRGPVSPASPLVLLMAWTTTQPTRRARG
jgi:hypothetical protein